MAVMPVRAFLALGTRSGFENRGRGNRAGGEEGDQALAVSLVSLHTAVPYVAFSILSWSKHAARAPVLVVRSTHTSRSSDVRTFIRCTSAIRIP